MRAVLKSIFSLDVDNLSEFCPADPDFFGVSLRLVIGSNNSVGEDLFDLLVCSPEWVKAECMNYNFVWGKDILILSEFRFDLIKKIIEEYVNSIEGSSWVEIAQSLSKVMGWEFENYRE